MSVYEIAARTRLSVSRRIDFAELRERFWRWWIGLYADPPRRLPPMI
jgi:hypothetical protein